MAADVAVAWADGYAEVELEPLGKRSYLVDVQRAGKQPLTARARAGAPAPHPLRHTLPVLLRLVFKVGNPTGATADITLFVDNTCPGWTATVSPMVLTNMAPGEVRENGDPLPDVIEPGQTLNLVGLLLPAVLPSAPGQDLPPGGYGDEMRIEYDRPPCSHPRSLSLSGSNVS